MRRDVVRYKRQREKVEKNKDVIESMLLAGMPVSPAGVFESLQPSMILTDCETSAATVFVTAGATPSSHSIPNQSVMSGETTESSLQPTPFYAHRHYHGQH